MKLKNKTLRVWVFVGDMAAKTGIFNECTKYACGHNLPIQFVVEDNGMSVDTETQKVWGKELPYFYNNKVRRYKYERTFPHQGSGKWVTF